MFSHWKRGDAVVALFVFLPLAAALSLSWAGRLGGAPDWMEWLGRGAAVLGLSSLLLAAMVSVRIPGFDVFFGGLTRLWKIHHVLGAASFLLLMLHPLLLAFAAARVSPRAAAAVLFPGTGAWSSWAGWLALAAMAVFLSPTFSFFGRPEYQRWKFLHALSGLALASGVAHALSSGRLLPGDWGGSIWMGYGALALAAFFYRLFVSRFVGRKEYSIIGAQSIARGIVELTLRPGGDLLGYRPGQFIYLTPLAPGLASGRGEEHPYTLSSARQEPVLRVVIKDLGDATRALQSAPLGSKALVEGPYGDFFPADANSAPELWIAGGVGLTPFLGRARAFVPDKRVDIRLIYCVQDDTRAHFLAELESIAGRIGGFRVGMHFFGREGPLSAEFIASFCPDFAGRWIYVCGPPPLTVGVRRELRRAGVSAARIRSEDFTWL